jgi:hypothetical protein
MLDKMHIILVENAAILNCCEERMLDLMKTNKVKEIGFIENPQVTTAHCCMGCLHHN